MEMECTLKQKYKIKKKIKIQVLSVLCTHTLATLHRKRQIQSYRQIYTNFQYPVEQITLLIKESA